MPDTAVMASFDIESLYTNVPLQETTQIIVNNLENYDHDTLGLNRQQLSKLLNIATSESVFTFEEKLYSQIDGVSMGSCLGPAYANAFLCHHEVSWLNNCPVSFKPLYYRRYVDDTFLIFSHPSHIDRFLQYLNSKHSNIKFSCEIELNNQLSFLDVQISNINGNFSTTVYRKPTFTGLGLNYLSFVPHLYKVNSIKTLINRAYNICCSYFLLNLEIEKLRKYFSENLYPSGLFEKTLKIFLNNKFSPKPAVTTVKKDIRYLRIPFVGHESFRIKKQLLNSIKCNYPQIDFRIAFSNPFTVGSALKKPIMRPLSLTSNAVYLFSCPCCNARYVGSSTRFIQHRICEHKGISYRTLLPLTKPPFSAIREHSHNSDHPYTDTAFEILTVSSTKTDLLILESLYINKMKPNLNTGTAVPLFTK